MEISAEAAKRRNAEKGKDLWTALQAHGEGNGSQRFYLIILDG